MKEPAMLSLFLFILYAFGAWVFYLWEAQPLVTAMGILAGVYWILFMGEE